MLYPDQRDATPQPRVYLSPLWILKMRERLKEAAADPYRSWPYGWRKP